MSHLQANEASFTRPNDTTAYASGDLVANNATAGSVAPLQFRVQNGGSGSLIMRRMRLRKSGTSLTNASFRAHFYKASPTPANGDNGAWSTSGVASYLGSMDVTMDKAFTDGASGAGLPTVGSEIMPDLGSGDIIYVLLEARAAYIPVAQEVFTLTIEDLEE